MLYLLWKNLNEMLLLYIVEISNQEKNDSTHFWGALLTDTNFKKIQQNVFSALILTNRQTEWTSQKAFKIFITQSFFFLFWPFFFINGFMDCRQICILWFKNFSYFSLIFPRQFHITTSIFLWHKLHFILESHMQLAI